ncbi:MAG: hypothetical protein ABI353_12960 [Isosphaeraceae bacterium]
MATNPTLSEIEINRPDASALCDADGPIPTFPPRALDEQGRLIPISPEERKARSEAAIRALRAIELLPDDDPPGSTEELFRSLDANRPEGAKQFEGMY